MRETLGLPDQYVQDLLKLVGTDIVVIADDSGSMNAVTDPRKITEPLTRWEELQQTLRMLVTMLLVVEHVEGFWLKFLNDPRWYKVTQKEQLEQIFAVKPQAHGKTPLKANLEPIMHGYGSEEKDTLLLILTDGEPSDCSFEDLSQVIRRKGSSVFCSFAMCTDESDIVERYNQVVDPIPGCDITGACCFEALSHACLSQMIMLRNALKQIVMVTSSRRTNGSLRCCWSSSPSTISSTKNDSLRARAAFLFNLPLRSASVRQAKSEISCRIHHSRFPSTRRQPFPSTGTLGTDGVACRSTVFAIFESVSPSYQNDVLLARCGRYRIRERVLDVAGGSCCCPPRPVHLIPRGQSPRKITLTSTSNFIRLRLLTYPPALSSRDLMLRLATLSPRRLLCTGRYFC